MPYGKRNSELQGARGFFHQGEIMRSRPVSCAAVELRHQYACLGSRLYVGIAIAGALSSALLAPTRAFAAEPAGHITIARDIPVHDAFRVGDAGQPTDIPTAREDIMITTTNTIGRIPQSLSDGALSNVAGQPSVHIETAQQIGSAAATSAIGISAAAFGQQPTLSGMPSAQAIGGAIAGGTASIAAAVSGLAGRK